MEIKEKFAGLFYIVVLEKPAQMTGNRHGTFRPLKWNERIIRLGEFDPVHLFEARRQSLSER